MSKFAPWRTRKPARHAAPPAVVPYRGVEFSPLGPGFMDQRPLANYADPTGLANYGLLTARDGHTATFGRIDDVPPVPAVVPPSQRNYDNLWRPAVSNQAAIPAQRQVSAEDSYENLRALAPVQRVNADWFRTDDTAGDRTLRQFLDRWAVIGAVNPAKPATSRLDVTALDTSIFHTVAASQFPAAGTTGKQEAA